MIKIPFIRLAGFGGKRPSTTGSTADPLAPHAAVLSPGLAQGSGNLQRSEAISYGPTPLQYAKSPVPDKRNVGVPIHQHTHFAPATSQRSKPPVNAKVRR